MFFASSVLVAALVSIVQAQTPSGFEPSVKTQLNVFFNSTAVSSPGQLLTKAATASAPQIAASGPNINAEDTYVFVMLDLDVPPGGGSSTRRVLLHAMTTDFKATTQALSGGSKLLASQSKGPATYLGPSPPASDAMPHRYVQLLFKQPASLQVQATEFANTQSRINFNITEFAAKNSLGKPLAGNFFTVSGQAGGNGGAAASSGGGSRGTATGSGGLPRNTLQPFEGAAGKLDVSLGFAGLIGGLVVAMV
ncbi:phosphatidylethanolamine-binding protein [Dendryphion nanum]|uniref:Phosphatidylethanolamine-binding protein n=1 Tax=Dendryphion nanum TaxID=256645 RepID=A0A9P9EDD7_9PLEO|nr:phosphatidylethanolamine-binding protein [Dendryphion nanum]